MSLPILFHFLCTQHVSDINISIIRSLRLCCRLKPATRTLLKPNRTQHNLYFSLQHGHYSNPAAHNTPVLQPATRILLKPSHTQHNLCFSLQHGHYSNPAAYNTPVLQPATRTPLKPSCTQHTCASACNTDTTQTQPHQTSNTTCASVCNTDTTQNQPHQISNTQRTENKTTDVVIQQHSRKLWWWIY